MTNVESMDYTHSHPSTIASLSSTDNFHRYHKPTIYLPQNNHHTYWGSPILGGLRTAGLSPLAGLLDYEDTRLKTSSRVRMGLYLAWKAS